MLLGLKGFCAGILLSLLEERAEMRWNKQGIILPENAGLS